MSGIADIVEEAQLETLIPAFYARVRQDPLIGPIFNEAVEDWDDHLGKLTAFWSSVMLTSGRYKGSPMAAHLRHVDAITPEMFTRWLAIWSETTAELLPAPAAAALQARAARIAESLQLGLQFRPGARAA
jgi:hemoglobin